jgi:hypothetical protein
MVEFISACIAVGFGLSMLLFFIGQGLRLLLDVIDILTER